MSKPSSLKPHLYWTGFCSPPLLAPLAACSQDIKPTHSKHARARDAAAGGADDEDDEGGDDDDDDELRVWNLRKCSAAALDMLSNHLSDEHVLPLLLPIVQQRLADQDWKVQGNLWVFFWGGARGVVLKITVAIRIPLTLWQLEVFAKLTCSGFCGTDRFCVACCGALCRFVRVPSLPWVL